VRGVLLLLLLVLVTTGAVSSAIAQPKDPFRPPGTSAGDGSGLPGGERPSGVAPPAEPAPGDGLARTGQDVGSPFAVGSALIAFGLALHLIATVRRGVGRWPPLGEAAGRASPESRVPIPLKNTPL
jgi:hypothetical protein